LGRCSICRAREGWKQATRNIGQRGAVVADRCVLF
jgi:hypothetical protein